VPPDDRQNIAKQLVSGFDLPQNVSNFAKLSVCQKEGSAAGYGRHCRKI
jgi:hypothetical protein